MNKEEINNVFDYIEKTFNKQKLFEFRLSTDNQIKAYFKGTNKVFAHFYINTILKLIKKEKNND